MSVVDTKASLPHHYEARVLVPAPVDRVFAHIDEHARLSRHMSEASWMMGGGQMQVVLDEAKAKKVGARIRLAGRVFGMNLAVDEVVTEYAPPFRKTWVTTGTPRLLVIGDYRMGFILKPDGSGSQLLVFIDYDLPQRGIAHWLGRLLGNFYARWCTRQMANEVVSHFTATGQ